MIFIAICSSLEYALEGPPFEDGNPVSAMGGAGRGADDDFGNVVAVAAVAGEERYRRRRSGAGLCK